MSYKILLVDDDPFVCRTLTLSLGRAGYQVVTAGDAVQGLALAQGSLVDLVLLDIILPGMDGLEALPIFQRDLRLPVILLTGRRSGHDEALGLELGADDYVTKPFDVDVLLARIASVLRRSSPQPTSVTLQRLVVGDLVIDQRARTAVFCGQELALSPRTFKLLTLLASHAGQVMSLDTLMTQVWGREFTGEPQAVYVHVRWLREKLAIVCGHSIRILTVHRVGYKLVAEETSC